MRSIGIKPPRQTDPRSGEGHPAPATTQIRPVPRGAGFSLGHWELQRPKAARKSFRFFRWLRPCTYDVKYHSGKGIDACHPKDHTGERDRSNSPNFLYFRQQD